MEGGSFVIGEWENGVLRHNGRYDEAFDLLSPTASDILAVIVDDDEYPVGTIKGVANFYNMAQFAPFGLIMDDFASAGFTLAHEMGHAMGGKHTWFATDTNPVNPYGRGHYDAFWQTIMGAYEMCPGATPCVTRMIRWSNPDQSFLGDPLGVPIGTDPGEADGRANMNLLMPTVAGWR